MTDVLTGGLVLAGVLLGLVLGFFVGRILTARWLEAQFEQREDAARTDAHRRSRATFGGQALEELAPLFPDFPFNPKDLRFIGDPIDYVVFDGLTEGTLREVVLLEVKSGRSTLSPSQRSIRDALKDRAVSWALYRVPAELTELP